MRAPEEIPYSWDLVFRVSTRKELKTLCEVCKLFNDLATPLMYRSVILSKSHITGENWDVLPSEVDDPAKAKDLSCSLFYRLLHDEKIRAQTRDLTLAEIEDRADMALVRQKLKHPDDPLTSLVKQMPNLGNVYFHGKFLLTERVLSALTEHKRSPKLHLFGCYHTSQISAPIPTVRMLHIHVPTHTYHYVEGPVEHASVLRDVFATYPNLEDSCVSVTRYQRCQMGGRGVSFSRKILEFVSPEPNSNLSEPSLSLSRYCLGHEASFWREQFPLHNLRSLSLGPDDNPGFLENVGDCVKNLTSFTITKFCTETAMTHAGLDSFLFSFHTLERLTAKEYVPSVHAVAHHPDLKHFCLHSIEHLDRERLILSVTDMEFLDQSYPNLTTLEVDMNSDGVWPGPFINSLAMGFLNLRELSIHVELGIRRVELEWQLQEQLRRQLEWQMRQRPKEHFADEDNSDKSCSEMGSADMQDFDEWTDESMKSVLTVSKAHHLGKRFFGRRHGISRLEKITVRTGEKLRDDSPRLAIYLPSEDQYERIFEIYPPPTKGDNPLLKEMESKLAQMRRETNERLDRMFGPVKRVIVKDRE